MHGLTLIWVVARKDLKIEYRSRQAFLNTLFFAFLILVIFNFAFDPGSRSTREAAAGILWVALLFPGIIQLNRSFQAETEEGTLYGLILSPVDRGLIFLGKFAANWIFLICIDLLLLVIFTIFYNFSFDQGTLWIALLVLLVSCGFSALGTLFAAMVSSIRTREVLLPILLFPMVVPIILAAVNSTQEVLLQRELQAIYTGLKILAGFDIIFVSLCFLVFDYVLGD